MSLRVLLMQLPVPNNAATNVPLAAGYLKAYAHVQGLLDRVQIEILPRALADAAGDALLVRQIVARAPAVLGISLYTWNSERSLNVAQRVKAQLPDLLVVVGGPEVQHDNAWVLHHPAVDVAVLGEGEQTFAELLQLILNAGQSRPVPAHLLAHLPGIALRDSLGNLLLTPQRQALSDLSVVPSPYLLGYLEPPAMLMVEVSRWCPYACSFCLYGRSMGSKLGNRYFPLEQILAEIHWGRDHGATSVHFIEANLNLVPLFRPLMAALADLNADGRLALYAELRGEHLTEEAVAALVRAGLRVAEVGLQTANQAALRAALRRTDLRKWAAGTRRLYQHGVEVLLDVILGLPEDDAAGVAETLAFIEQENLGPYDIFTLQVLPGTAVRQHADQYALRFQERPPYYILGTDRLAFADLRRLRQNLKRGIGLDPDAVEGCPAPRMGALADDRPPTTDHGRPATDHGRPDSAILTSVIWTLTPDPRPLTPEPRPLAAHVDIVAHWSRISNDVDTALLAEWILPNPSTLFDLYLLADVPPDAATVVTWRDRLPYQPGYLDRVAVYRCDSPGVEHERVSPRVWLVVPWTAQIEPEDYRGAAELIWTYELASGEEPPLGAWRSAGGAGIWARGATAAQAAAWSEQSGLLIWWGS